MARHFGIARSTLYLNARQAAKDQLLLAEVLRVMDLHPHYGHRRLALVLGRSKDTIRRIMVKYGLKSRRRRRRSKYRAYTSPNPPIPNRTKRRSPIMPNAWWAGDFTTLSFRGLAIYVATVIDLYTREIVGWSVGLHHSAQLVIDALEDARRRRRLTPHLFHSDQGSEYDSIACRAWLLAHRILPSHSAKSHPWENGRQESFYGKFKAELEGLYRFASLEDAIAAIHHQIHYYNTLRIHSALKMTPQQFYERTNTALSEPHPPDHHSLSTPVS